MAGSLSAPSMAFNGESLISFIIPCKGSDVGCEIDAVSITMVDCHVHTGRYSLVAFDVEGCKAV